MGLLPPKNVPQAVQVNAKINTLFNTLSDIFMHFRFLSAISFGTLLLEHTPPYHVPRYILTNFIR